MKRRYELLDTLRGFSLINMICYHFIWDLIYIFSFINNIMPNLFYIWQQFICISFIFISGFCWQLGRNHVKHGTVIFVCGLLITIITYVFTPRNTIIFGILTFLGSAALLTIPLHKILSRLNYCLGFMLSLCLFIFFKHIQNGYIGFSFYKIKIPSIIYNNYITAYLGFPYDNFASADYFPLLPWIFLFISGYYAYKFCYARNILPYLSLKIISPLNFLGKKSLIVYLSHQPIIYSALYIFAEL